MQQWRNINERWQTELTHNIKNYKHSIYGRPLNCQHVQIVAPIQHRPPEISTVTSSIDTTLNSWNIYQFNLDPLGTPEDFVKKKLPVQFTISNMKNSSDSDALLNAQYFVKNIFI